MDEKIDSKIIFEIIENWPIYGTVKDFMKNEECKKNATSIANIFSVLFFFLYTWSTNMNIIGIYYMDLF